MPVRDAEDVERKVEVSKKRTMRGRVLGQVQLTG
jgi:hypothetical protein